MGAPLVSIGLPVFNGAKYLEGALDSLLAQDHAHFELIISDNASTDRTPQICSRYAENDKRIQFHRNASNLGAVENFNRVFRLSRGDYFMWAAHDDLWHSTYITRCLAGLGQDSNIVLCASAIHFIDQSGHRVPEEQWRALLGGGYNTMQTRSLGLRARVRKLTEAINWYALYGIIRSDVLRRTRLYQKAFGGDVILLMELLFHGQTYILEEPLFCYRLPEIRKEDSTTTTSRREALGPYTGLVNNLLNTIEESSFSPGIKTALRKDLLKNVSRTSPQWVNVIQSENPSVGTIAPQYRSLQIRQMFYGGLCAASSGAEDQS